MCKTFALPLLCLISVTSVEAEEISLTLNDLRTLQPQDQFAIELPDGRSAHLTVIARHHRGTQAVITAQAAHLVSTFTFNDTAFFATVATPASTFQLTHSHGRTTAVDHRHLDQRTIGFADDFRRVR